ARVGDLVRADLEGALGGLEVEYGGFRSRESDHDSVGYDRWRGPLVGPAETPGRMSRGPPAVSVQRIGPFEPPRLDRNDRSALGPNAAVPASGFRVGHA